MSTISTPRVNDSMGISNRPASPALLCTSENASTALARRLDLNQLVVLDAVLTERSVKRAAERLYLSPPPASCALARLRDYFKDELLVQIGKTMVLTPKAETMQKPVRDVLLQIQAITTMDSAFDPMTSTRKITIEASDYVMNVFLAEVLRQAWHEAPEMQFDLRLIGTHSHSDLDNGEVDMLTGPDFFASPGHPSEPLCQDTWSCLTWVGNTGVRNTLSLDEYPSLGHVIIEWGAGRLTTSDERIAAGALQAEVPLLLHRTPVLCVWWPWPVSRDGDRRIMEWGTSFSPYGS
jgi:DNA-binding transcriptional LysR family regulator